ncbi:MAG: restriction endonuclease [Candidatus Levyibacteriota bacterium]|nr:MAG: restriction endonuclease [Candidatus Levybacteria bacterium]
MINVVKADGSKQEFNEEKVRQSIKRAGIPNDLQNQVLEHVKSKLYENIKTAQIYKHIIEFLGKTNPHAKAKYSLKQAIMRLGPTGYPFEDFVAEIMRTQGYTTYVRTILQGTCITHEIDVIATKNPPAGGEKIMVEAKFHNMPGIKTNVHVALYTKARFDDIAMKNNFTNAWIVTNTKVTTDAIAYSECQNITIISWEYPQKGNLRDLIEQSGLAPITSITEFSTNDIQKLLENGIVLCRDICKKPEILNLLDMPEDKKKHILDQAAFVCNLS